VKKNQDKQIKGLAEETNSMMSDKHKFMVILYFNVSLIKRTEK